MKWADLHCDTIFELYEKKRRGEEVSLLKNDLDVDIEKLQKGGALLQNFAVFLNLKNTPSPFAQANAMMDLFFEELSKNEEHMALARSYEDICRNEKAGKISAVLTLEEGEICEGSPEKLTALYGRGARMMTLTWNYENSLAHPSRVRLDENKKPAGLLPETEKGLKERGFEFLSRMEELGMIVDVSHLSDKGIDDVLSAAKKPFVASHSNARAVASSARNLTNDMIRRMAEKGCIAGINYYPPFLRDFSSQDGIADCICHIRHMVNIGGIEFVALGSDFDGFGEVPAWGDASRLPLLFEGLRKAGFSEGEIEKISHGNVLRLYKELL